MDERTQKLGNMSNTGNAKNDWSLKQLDLWKLPGVVETVCRFVLQQLIVYVSALRLLPSAVHSEDQASERQEHYNTPIEPYQDNFLAGLTCPLQNTRAYIANYLHALNSECISN